MNAPSFLKDAETWLRIQPSTPLEHGLHAALERLVGSVGPGIRMDPLYREESIGVPSLPAVLTLPLRATAVMRRDHPQQLVSMTVHEHGYPFNRRYGQYVTEHELLLADRYTIMAHLHERMLRDLAHDLHTSSGR
jgi:hypothetical protein